MVCDVDRRPHQCIADSACFLIGFASWPVELLLRWNRNIETVQGNGDEAVMSHEIN
jgi:hypothetical protein